MILIRIIYKFFINYFNKITIRIFYNQAFLLPPPVVCNPTAVLKLS